MRIKAIVKRVLLQMVRDKRTLALLFLAPLLVLSLMYVLFQSNQTTTATIGIRSNVDADLVKAIKSDDLTVKTYGRHANAKTEIRRHDLAGFITQDGDKLRVTYQNSQPSQAALIRQSLIQGQTKLQFKALTAVTKAQQAALKQTQSQLNQLTASLPASSPASSQQSATNQPPTKVQQPTRYHVTSHYLYGSQDSTFFVEFLPILLGFFVFFFVFLISGMSLLNERTSGTLTRLLATPVRRGEIITGYMIGYGLFAIVQTLIICTFSIYVFNVHILGSFWLLVLINLVLALVALSMGIFISTFANTEFQMIQFIPLVVVPQVFFSGLVPVSGMATWLQVLAHVFPLYYGGAALTDVATKGFTFGDVAPELGILLLFVIILTGLNTVGLRRYRRV
ncbi:ABC transporter permease [Levilactobacillus bambusae]|uniref:ABC transporter permease n=1 Tax=Levilactobacillus bambusae TaxID=2024736 RepID=A0A2V1N1C6_9LACO|nr:ABC transporter permease [Levilactobacillus bambusae]PWG00538.1 ABC transporter permease [Levilactobacillus bambusae]